MHMAFPFCKILASHFIIFLVSSLQLEQSQNASVFITKRNSFTCLKNQMKESISPYSMMSLFLSFSRSWSHHHSYRCCTPVKQNKCSCKENWPPIPSLNILAILIIYNWILKILEDNIFLTPWPSTQISNLEIKSDSNLKSFQDPTWTCCQKNCRLSCN